MHPAIILILKILKRMSIILLIVTGTIFLALTILFLFYKNQIQQIVIHEINRNLTAEVRTGRISVSLLAHFPMITVKLKDVRILDAPGISEGADLLHAEECSMRFNIMDALHKKYTLEVVKLDNASVNLVVYEDGRDNFHFWKSSTAPDTGKFAVEIRQVILHGVDLTWQNLGTGDMYSVQAVDSRARGNFSDESYDLTVRGNFVARLIRKGGRTYVQDRELDASVRLYVNTADQTYRVTEGMIRTGLVTINLDGTVKRKGGQEADLNVRIEEAPLKEYLSLIPADYMKWTQKMTMDGNVSASVTIKGQMNESRIPDMKVIFRLARGYVILKKPAVRFTDLLAEGSYSIRSGTGSSINDELRIERLMASLGDGRVEGSVRLTDLSHPVASLAASMDLGLSDLAGLLPMEMPEDADGRLDLQIDMKGPLNDLRKIDARDLFNWNIQGDATLRINRLDIKKSPVRYHDVRGTFHFDNQLLTIKDLSGKAGNSDFSVRGIVLNYLPGIFSRDEILKMDLSLTSSQLNINEFINNNTDKPSPGNPYQLPSNITVNADVSIRKFSLEDFSASGMQTRLIMREGRITLEDLTFSSMQGNITANVDLSPASDQLYLFRCNARLKHVDIRQLFHDFRNFRQTSLTENHLRGFVDADMYFTSRLSPDLTIDVSSIYTLGNITITSGELIGFTPLYQLAGFLDIEDLKHIRFSELKNLIEIRNRTIVIPEMDITSNTLDLTLNGVHTFSNKIDYHVSLLLSQLLSRKVKPDTQQEFGVVEDDGLGRTRLYIAMTGTMDHPKFSYDRPALKDKLAKDLQKERQVLKAALQDEFNIHGEDVQKADKITRREQVKFIIDREGENPPDTVGQKQDLKKIKGPKFNVKWEDDDTLGLRPGE